MEEQKKKISGKKIGLIVGIILVILVASFSIAATQVKQKTKTMSYELGTQISHSMKDYLTGPGFVTFAGRLDLNKVDQERPGTYEATVKMLNHTYKYEITLTDTVKPEQVAKEGTIYAAAHRKLKPDVLVESVNDADVDAKLTFVTEAGPQDVMTIDDIGEYQIQVAATDTSGNQTVVEYTLHIDTAPVLTGAKDIYVTPGNEIGMMDGVTATDDVDGDLTSAIELKQDEDIDFSKEGKYKAKYIVEDQYGLKTVQKIEVVIADDDSIQQMITARKINISDDKIIGAINPYDIGISETDDIEAEKNVERVAVVHYSTRHTKEIHQEFDWGYREGTITYGYDGSGYIAEITDDTIYMLTNQHVLAMGKQFSCTFYDGTKVTATSLGSSKNYDVGVATVPVSSVSPELLQSLRTVHFDMTFWNSIPNSSDTVNIGYDTLADGGSVLRTTTGTLVNVKTAVPSGNFKPRSELAMKIIAGDSGSAVYDGYGHMISMATSTCYWEGETTYWGISLDDIVNSYKEITGRDLKTY